MFIIDVTTSHSSYLEIKENNENIYMRKINGLMPLTQYRIRIFAYNQKGNSTETNPVALQVLTRGLVLRQLAFVHVHVL